MISSSRRVFEKISATLRSLTLNFCEIKSIEAEAFFNLIKLEKLDLSGNKLTLLEAVHFEYVPSLRYLDISFNEIRAIDDIIFYNLQKLENFYFDYNNVWTLSGRMLQRFRSDVIPRVNLRKLRFGRNPINWE